jgi:hypothetical protein
MMEQETTTTTTKRVSSYARKKQIQYSCGCRYLFNHQIILDHVCSEHERELIAPHGWDCILKYWNFHILLSYYFLALLCPSSLTKNFWKEDLFWLSGIVFLSKILYDCGASLKHVCEYLLKNRKKIVVYT